MLRSEDPELYLEKAVHRLCDYYGKALTLEYVRNKIAWALYQTWKEFDKKSEERRMPLYDSDAKEDYLLDGRYVIKPLVRCKDCKHFEYDHPYIIQGMPVLGHEVCNAWGNGCKTDENGYCFMAERRKK